MHTRHRAVLFAAVCSFAGWSAALAQSDPVAPKALSSPVFARGGCGLQLEADGRLIGVAQGYHAEFGEAGVRYTPALGANAPHDLPLAFEFVQVGRGNALASPKAPQRRHDELVVTYERGAVAETYEVRTDGVKQCFVFRELPRGEGDLVVRGKVTTALVPSEVAADGVVYSLPGAGGVTIGTVLGIDAAGNQVRGAMQVTENGLEFRLPAAFVDRAVLPLVLDPLIGTQVVLGGVNDDEQPDVAWDETSASWLVVWQRVLSTTNSDICAQRLDAAGALVGGTISIESGAATLALRPRVANINGANAFIVVFSVGSTVFARGVNVSTGTAVLTPQELVGTGLVATPNPDVGGEALDIASGAAVVVWNPGGAIRTATAHCSAANVLTIGAAQLVTFFINPVDISISQSGGQNGYWLIAFEIDVLGIDTIQGCVWSRNGTGPVVRTTLASGTESSSQAAVDGDGDNWVVAYSRDELNGTDRDIYVRAVGRSGSALILGVPVPIANGVGDDEAAPSVAWLGNSVLVGWQDEVAGGSYDTYVKSIDPFGCGPCEDTFSLGISAVDERAVQIGTQFAGRAFGSRDAALVWQRASSLGRSHDVVFQGFRASHGAYTDLGGRCDAGGIAQATCAGSPHPAFRVRLRGAPAGAAVVGIIGFSTLNYGCGSCLVVPDPYTGLVWTQTADSLGNTQLNFPILPGAAGAEFYLQFLHLVPPPTPCSIDFNSSNALRVGIETL